MSLPTDPPQQIPRVPGDHCGQPIPISPGLQYGRQRIELILYQQGPRGHIVCRMGSAATHERWVKWHELVE